MKVISVAVSLICLWLAATAGADEVVLDNGSILKGNIDQVTGNTVIITSDYAEPIKVKKGRVIKIIMKTETEAHLEHDEVLKGNISTINPPLSRQWNGSVTAGGNIMTGNNDRAALALATEGERKGEDDRFSLQVRYSIAQSEGALSTRNAFGALEYNRFFTKEWYGLLSVSLLNDTFQDLNLRTIVGPGIGYQFWDESKQHLSLETGIAYLSEDHKAHPDTSWFTLRLAGRYNYPVSDTILFSNQLILYPSLEKLGEFELRNEAALSTSLGASWSMKLTSILDYVDSPPSGVKNLDSNIMLGLQYGF
jgi:putative salt-induced outer membrane protein YdiY